MAVTSPTELPTPQTLQEIAKVEVWDEDGNKVPFGSIYGEEKAVVVFIRTSLSFGVSSEVTDGGGVLWFFGQVISFVG